MTLMRAHTKSRPIGRQAAGALAAMALLSACAASDAQDGSVQATLPTSLTAGSPPLCEGSSPLTLDGFELGDAMAYIDAPDMNVIRATTPLEIGLTASLSREEIQPPLSKTYCQIGATRMVVEMAHTVEDDAVSALTLRAIYRWIADESGTGWQITEIGTRYHCARGRDQETDLCL